MGLLTTEEAARLLRDELGWPLLASDVESAAKRGRLRAEKGPGRHDYLIPEEEVLRFVDEHRDKKLTDTQRERAEELEAAVWEGVPRNGMEFLFGFRRKRRRSGWRNP